MDGAWLLLVPVKIVVL